MMKTRRILCALCTGAMALVLIGCQPMQRAHDRSMDGSTHAAVHTGLVMPGEAMVALGAHGESEGGWEVSRNDPRTRTRSVPDYSDRRVIEHRHREHLRTINGRPREYTSTTTRVWQRHGPRRYPRYRGW